VDKRGEVRMLKRGESKKIIIIGDVEKKEEKMGRSIIIGDVREKRRDQGTRVIVDLCFA
jgi:hypothetical protein